MSSQNSGPALLPPRVDPDEVLKGFCSDKLAALDHHKMTRPQVMLLLAEKHRLLAEKLSEEKKALEGKTTKMIPILEDSKKKRDAGNTNVHALKEKRSKLHTERRVLREQFFSLLSEADVLDDAVSKTGKIRKDIEGLDWKIQTEAVTIEQERGLMDQIKKYMESISQANMDYQKKKGIEARVRAIAEGIGQRSKEAEETHEKLLKEVKEADVAHAMIKRLEPIVGPATRRTEWLGHRIQLHIESADYWEDRVQREPKTSTKPKGQGKPKGKAKQSESKAKQPEGKKKAPKETESKKSKSAKSKSTPKAEKKAPAKAEKKEAPKPAKEPETQKQAETSEPAKSPEPKPVETAKPVETPKPAKNPEPKPTETSKPVETPKSTETPKEGGSND